MKILYYLIEGAACFCESYLCYRLVNIIFNVNDNKKYTWKLAILLSGLVLSLNHFCLFSTFTLIFAILFVTLTETLIFKIKFIDALSVAGFFSIFLNTFDFLSLSIIGTVLGKSNFAELVTSNFSIYRILFLVCSKSVLMVFFMIAKHSAHKIYRCVKEHYFIIISSMGAIGILYMIRLTMEKSDINSSLNWGLLLSVLIAFYYAFYIYTRYKEERDKNDFIQFHNTAILHQYDELINNYKKNSQNFHDMENHMNALYKMLLNNENMRAQKYIEEFIDIKNTQDVSWTGNEIWDYIINSKKSVAEEHGIVFMIDADYIRYRKITDKIMCSVLSNLLDNAIEACVKIKERQKYISLAVRNINDMLIIKISNNLEEIPIKKGDIFVSTKNDLKNHGWGIQSVISAVESNNGVITYHFDENDFVVNVAFF